MDQIELSKIDLTKVAVGTFANFGGQPVDYAKTAIFDRAGVPQNDPLRVELQYTHASTQGKVVPRLPEVFPPASLPEGQKLSSAQDYLDLIAATPPEFVPSPAEIKAAEEARKLAEANAQSLGDVNNQIEDENSQSEKALQPPTPNLSPLGANASQVTQQVIQHETI